jgi:hypothetical protein
MMSVYTKKRPLPERVLTNFRASTTGNAPVSPRLFELFVYYALISDSLNCELLDHIDERVVVILADWEVPFDSEMLLSR